MEYVINDFSLRGQFANEDAFYDSIGKYTLPVLKKIEKEKDSIIWKKDTLWTEVCPESHWESFGQEETNVI